MSILLTGLSQQNGPGELEGGTPGVTLISVTKEYEGHKMAVQELTLTFRRDQITALLGTNGAGKTTIMCVSFSITYFLFPPPYPSFSFLCLHPSFLLLLPSLVFYCCCFALMSIESLVIQKSKLSPKHDPVPIVLNHILDLE